MTINVNAKPVVSFDDLTMLEQPKSHVPTAADKHVGLDLAESRLSAVQQLLTKPNLVGPLLERPGTVQLQTRATDVSAPLHEARALLSEHPLAAKMVLSSIQRASGAALDYKVDLTAAVAAQLHLEKLDESEAPLGALSLHMSHKNGLNLQIERLDCLLEAVRTAGTFLRNIAEPSLRARYIEANAAPDEGEIRTPSAHQEAIARTESSLEEQRSGMRSNLSAFYREAVDLIYDVSRGLEAVSFAATAEGMLREEVPLSNVQLRKIEADRQAMRWPHLPALLPKFFAAYEQTYVSPSGAMLAVHAWRNNMLERAHKSTVVFSGL